MSSPCMHNDCDNEGEYCDDCTQNFMNGHYEDYYEPKEETEEDEDGN